jgi:3-methyladenine DNA glycosylase Tag
MIPFAPIRTRAEARKGDALAALLGAVPDNASLRAVRDDRVLAEIARRIFSAGFSWDVIEAKWPGFEAAFLGFDPGALLIQPPDFWDARLKDTRIVRNGAKIMALRANAGFVADIAAEHGSFGAFLAAWPADDEAGLLTLLAKRGSHLGGRSAQFMLRALGWDTYILTTDVIACLRDAGVDIGPEPKTKSDFAKVQAAFTAWHAETGLPYTHLSRLCAFSVGENRMSAPD